MIEFDTLYTEFENTKNVSLFYDAYKDNSVSIRFLLIRSLDKKNLLDILSVSSMDDTNRKIKDLTRLVYNSDITIPQLIDYIENQRSELIKSREKELEGITNVISRIPIVNCGIGNDKVDTIVNHVVRDKNIKSIESLNAAIDSSIERVRQYILWTYYNQNTNDIIELYFLKHPRIIPTLRKIPNIDFFIKFEEQIIPFDLKVTHISDNFFDFLSKGVIDCTQSSIPFDDYTCSQNSDETSIIRTFYRAHKKLWDLPNYGKMSKNQLMETLQKITNNEVQAFVSDMKKNRSFLVDKTIHSPQILEWFNYKDQGQRLFNNNNRFYIFFAYKTDFKDGRPLKGKTEKIGDLIHETLDNIQLQDIHQIHYHYEKDQSLLDDYSALSLSILYTE